MVAYAALSSKSPECVARTATAKPTIWLGIGYRRALLLHSPCRILSHSLTHSVAHPLSQHTTKSSLWNIFAYTTQYTHCNHPPVNRRNETINEIYTWLTLVDRVYTSGCSNIFSIPWPIVIFVTSFLLLTWTRHRHLLQYDFEQHRVNIIQSTHYETFSSLTVSPSDTRSASNSNRDFAIECNGFSTHTHTINVFAMIV